MSLRAGQRAAAVMSLIQSAKLNGHDPYAYLKDVFLRLPTQPHSRIAGSTADHLLALADKCAALVKMCSPRVYGQPTMKDTMVAGHVYLSSLEARFDTAQQLVACYRAWKQNESAQPGNMADDQLEPAKQWQSAHDYADGIARPWLSNPRGQTFALKLAA